MVSLVISWLIIMVNVLASVLFSLNALRSPLFQMHSLDLVVSIAKNKLKHGRRLLRRFTKRVAKSFFRSGTVAEQLFLISLVEVLLLHPALLQSALLTHTPRDLTQFPRK